MIDYQGQTALITGASSGIGTGFASELASRGARVVLVARTAQKLESLAVKIRKQYKTDAYVIAADLSKEKSPDTLYRQTTKMGLSIDILVNNAGFGTYGKFHTLSADREQEEILLNCVAPVRLTHLFLPGMLAKSEGIIVNVASTAAFQPVPFMAVYGATKAFVLSFSEALWVEYRGKNIKVLALCPGATDTNFFNVVGTEEATVGRKRDIEVVVATALRALDRGKPSVIDGGSNYLLAQANRFTPRSITALVAGRMMRPGKNKAG